VQNSEKEWGNADVRSYAVNQSKKSGERFFSHIISVHGGGEGSQVHGSQWGESAVLPITEELEIGGGSPRKKHQK